MRKKIVLIFITILFTLMIPTIVNAVDFYCNCGNSYCGKSLRGIWHQVYQHREAWLYSDFNEEDILGSRSLQEGVTNTNYLWGNEYRAGDRTGIINRMSAICYGHRDATLVNTTKTIVRTVIDIDEKMPLKKEKYSDSRKNELMLAWHIYKSTISGNHVSKNSREKMHIRDWLKKLYGMYGGVIQGGKTDNTLDYNTAEAKEYVDRIMDQKIDASKSTNQTIEYKNGYTYIGPYNLTTLKGKLSRATIYTNNGANYETVLCSTDGYNIISLENIGDYQGDNFYIVYHGDIDSVEKIKLNKTIDAIHARIVLAEPLAAPGQNVGIFYGKMDVRIIEGELPGIPFGNIEIKKVDADNPNIILSNVGFRIQKDDGTYLRQEGNNSEIKYVTSENVATTFFTNQYGSIEIKNVKPGTYIFHEVSNPNTAYEVKSFSPEVRKITAGTSNLITIKNERTYINISGYVWENMIGGKASNADNVYTQNTDKKLRNVPVKLVFKNGESISTTTNYNGEYSFERVNIDSLVGAYIEFEYNGMCYQSLSKNSADNGNKATDNELRDGFNENYAIIQKDYSYSSQEEQRYPLSYNQENHKSILNYGGQYKLGYDGQKYPIAGIDEKYIIKANTEKNAGRTNLFGQGISTDRIRQQGITEIKNINLGVYEREMPDLALVQDVQDARLTIKGYEHLYEYSNRFKNNNDKLVENRGYDITASFGTTEGTKSYTREIYASDIAYKGNNELKIYITYKMQLRNESTTLTTRINSVANYYDKRYTNVSVGKGYENGIITEPLGSHTESYDDGEYNKVIINTGELGDFEYQSTKTIFIQYELNGEYTKSILDGEITLNSISEITSYSTLKDRKSYAGIDKDSAPDNIDLKDESKWEDDTDKAPSLVLKKKEGRVIEGVVWEDKGILNDLEEKKGNGKYDNLEDMIKNVKVELFEIMPNQNDSESVTLESKIEVVTDGNGKYSFSEVPPGDYIIKYTYDNESYILDPNKGLEVQEYKATIFREGKQIETNNVYWYLDDLLNDKDEDGNIDIISSAKDKTGIKQDGGEINDIVGKRVSGKEIYYDKVVYEGGTEEDKIKGIISETEKFSLKIDFDKDNYATNVTDGNKELTKSFPINFGITERPKQDIKVNKEISYVEVILTNGQVLISGDPRKGEIKYLKILTELDSNIVTGVYLEIDDEIIQGATLNIEYEITVDNTSCEVDYNHRGYYDYGIIPDEDKDRYKTFAKVNSLFDYVSNSLVFEQDKQKNSENVIWNKIEKTPEEMLENKEISENVKNAMGKYNTILYTEEFKNMGLGETKSVNIRLSKLLSNKENELNFENHVEVHSLEDRKVTNSTPGNYVPTVGPFELDDAVAELIITGATGENKDYTQYVILGISSCIILTIGVILIKRKIVK